LYIRIVYFGKYIMAEIGDIFIPIAN